MTTDQLIEAPLAPNLFAQLSALWLGACGRTQPHRNREAAYTALEHLDDHMRRDIGLDPKEQPFLSRVDIILQLHR